MKRQHYVKAQYRAWKSGSYRFRKTWRQHVTPLFGEDYVCDISISFYENPDDLPF